MVGRVFSARIIQRPFPRRGRGGEAVNGKEFIEVICRHRTEQGKLNHDGNIVNEIMELTDGQLQQIVTFGDVVEWRNNRIKLNERVEEEKL